MRNWLAGGVAAVVAAGAAWGAPTVLNQWTASTAEADAFATSGGGHAFWFQNALVPGGGAQYVFTGNAGLLEEIDLDMDAAGDELRLTGTIVSKSDAAYAYDVDIYFTARGPGAMSPKKELKPGAYSGNGGPVDTGTWTYWTIDASRATLTGAGVATLGDLFELFPFPVDDSLPFQVGIGANGKNVRFGGSSWFGFDLDDVSYRGDININLMRVIPTPGAALLGSLGLAGLALSRRRLDAGDPAASDGCRV